MTPQLPKEIADELHSNAGAVRVTDPTTQRVYVIVEDDVHRRAMEALRRQEDRDAIQAGIDDMEAGRTMSLEESKRRTEEALLRSRK